MSISIVSLSEQTFFTVATAALEAYKVDHAKAETEVPEKYLETFGNLWGYCFTKNTKEDVYRIVMADVSTAADRSKESVVYKDSSYEAKREFVAIYYPELTYLGDYHSHPYTIEESGIKTELELERQKLYQFSNGDFRSVKEQHEKGYEYRIGLVATVYERDEGISRSTKHLDGESCIRFQYQNMTIWLKAYAWSQNDNDAYRRKADKKVKLICPNLGFNAG